MYKLIHLKDGRRRRAQKIQRPSIWIGRDPFCFIRLEDPEAAERHVQLQMRGTEVFLLPASEETAVYVNAIRVAGDTLLQSGDTIRLGQSLFRFQYGLSAVALAFRVALGVLLAAALITAVWAWRQASSARRAEARKARAPAEAPATSEESPGPLPGPTAELPAPPAGVIDRARSMLAIARQARERGALEEAQQQLERVSLMVPAFPEAWAERARLWEAQNQPLRAQQEWVRVLEFASDADMQGEAAEALARMASVGLPDRAAPPVFVPPEAETIASTPRRPPGEGTPVPPPVPARPVLRLGEVSHGRFPASDRFDEMRMLRIELEPVGPRTALDPEAVRLEVQFFDRLASGAIVPSKAVITHSTVEPLGTWNDGKPRAITVVYVIPLGQRMAEHRRLGAASKYYGYAIRLFYRGQPQATVSKPSDLKPGG